MAIQGLTAGVMSWFSSSIGVVWPTLVPTVSSIAQNVGISPVGLIMAANATDPEFDKEKENRLFVQLFGLSAASLALIVVAALLGVYNIL